MNGFERAEWSAAWPDAEDLIFPDDFTADEAAFAHDLREIYAIERDEPPPLYAQTLLSGERPAVAEAGFEQRVFYAVFRRLGLARPTPLDGAPALAWLRSLGRSMADSFGAIPRALATASMALMALMALTVVLASPSFAAGLRILLGNTGVQQTAHYPSNVTTTHHHIGAGAAQSAATPDPNTPVFWLGASYSGFTFAGVRELDRPQWAQGSLLDLTYIANPQGHVSTDLSAIINIREFRISSSWSAVLQLVQAGYASSVTVGDEQAVYVNGVWTNALDSAHLGNSAVWAAGQKSELILQYAGEIFWITGDQRYGVDEATLVDVAQHLLLSQLAKLTPRVQLTRLAGQELQAALADPGDGEVLALIPAGQTPSSGSASFVTVAGDATGS